MDVYLMVVHPGADLAAWLGRDVATQKLATAAAFTGIA
jgi:hypothetical protein